MLPGREVPMDEASIARVLATLRERFDVDTRRSSLYQDLKSGLARPASSTTCRCSSSAPRPCSTTCPAAACRWSVPVPAKPPRRSGRRPASVMSSAATMWNGLLPPSALYLSPELLRERLNDAPRIEVWADHARIADAHALGDQPLPPLPVAARETPPAMR